MATLVRIADGRRFRLPARAIMGRGAGATVVVEDAFASSIHARIFWTGSVWEIRDLGSRNGTYVNQAPLTTGSSRMLSPGDRIGLGESEAAWSFEEGAPPEAVAIDLASGEHVFGAGDLLQLPSSDAPAVSVFRTGEGAWRIEDETGAPRTAENGETLDVAGRSYRLELPEASDLTPIADTAFSLRNVTIRFHVPQSLERIALELVHARRQQWLEPREHAYLLYTLAKERDADRSKPESERGWRSVAWLTQALRMDDAAVNLLIHRARHQLAAAGVDGAGGIVEVKRGQRRFGTDRFEILSDAGR
jgi:hypothetical protein